MSPTDRTFNYGQAVILIDRKRRETYTTLQEGKVMNLNGNILNHDDLVELPDGGRIVSAKGSPYKVFKATLQQHLLYMNRYATIVYPKDIAAILMHGDIQPGQKVIEGGLGSGALSLSLLQHLGMGGSLVTYELREAAIRCGVRNINTFCGALADRHTVRHQDIYEGIEEVGVDRVVLDVPEPWRVVSHAAKSLVDGGLFASYLPTIIQVHELVKELRDHPEMYTTWTLETLERPWHVTEDSVRPEHKMTAHTGFLVFSRRSARWAKEDGASFNKQ